MLSVWLLPISSFISSLPTLLFLLFFLPSLHLHFPYSLILSTMFLFLSFSSSSTIFILGSWLFSLIDSSFISKTVGRLRIDVGFIRAKSFFHSFFLSPSRLDEDG